jgi:hypothetical protein
MLKRFVLVSVLCAPVGLMMGGCPVVTPPEAVLAGDWVTDDAEQGTVYIRFDENGQVLGFAVVDQQDGVVLIEVDGATSNVEGDDVTITVPRVGGTATFTGTLSADGNTMEGTLVGEVEVGDDITIIIPQGNVTFERVEECGDGFCSPGAFCVNDECVECEDDDDCAEGEACTDGVCGEGADECDGDEDCDEGEVCTDGECVPDGGNGGGDPANGQALYTGNGCNACHGADGSGPPNIQDATAQEIFDNASEDGADTHPLKVDGLTLEDAEDIAAYLATL